MKAITITVDEQLDARAAAEARRRGISKSELYRDGVTSIIAQHSPDEVGDGASGDADASEDLWGTLAGFIPSDDMTVAPGEIDDVVYGP